MRVPYSAGIVPPYRSCCNIIHNIMKAHHIPGGNGSNETTREKNAESSVKGNHSRRKVVVAEEKWGCSCDEAWGRVEDFYTWRSRSQHCASFSCRFVDVHDPCGTFPTGTNGGAPGSAQVGGTPAEPGKAGRNHRMKSPTCQWVNYDGKDLRSLSVPRINKHDSSYWTNYVPANPSLNAEIGS